MSGYRAHRARNIVNIMFTFGNVISYRIGIEHSLQRKCVPIENTFSVSMNKVSVLVAQEFLFLIFVNSIPSETLIRRNVVCLFSSERTEREIVLKMFRSNETYLKSCTNCIIVSMTTRIDSNKNTM